MLTMHPESHHQYVERVIDLLPAEANSILNLSIEEARQRVLTGTP